MDDSLRTAKLADALPKNGKKAFRPMAVSMERKA